MSANCSERDIIPSSSAANAIDRLAVEESGRGHRWSYPSSERQRTQVYLTLVNFATRYPEAKALKQISIEATADALVSLYSRLEILEKILSDMGSHFVSECRQEVSSVLSIRQMPTTPYHPMCNG